jgi:A/G-specific adenine glycosylase
MSVRRDKAEAHKGEASPPVILDTSIIKRIRKILLNWGQRNFRPFPWRDPHKRWHGLLAEVLLQRTRVSSVVSVYQQFISKYPEPYHLARASIKEIEELIYPLGLRWRAPLIKKLGEELESRGGVVPDSLQELLELPAVGPYAAAAYLGFHGGKRAVIIDANVVRLLCRIVDKPFDGETRRKKWLIMLADAVTPNNKWTEFNYAMLDFSMQICAKIPKCDVCPIGPALCLTGRKNLKEAGQTNDTSL